MRAGLVWLLLPPVWRRLWQGNLFKMFWPWSSSTIVTGHRPPTADRRLPTGSCWPTTVTCCCRPPTNNLRPATTDRWPPTSDPRPPASNIRCRPLATDRQTQTDSLIRTTDCRPSTFDWRVAISNQQPLTNDHRPNQTHKLLYNHRTPCVQIVSLRNMYCHLWEEFLHWSKLTRWGSLKL